MLAIIGGSGLYALDELEIITTHDIDTPFGKPSAPIIEAQAFGSKVLFLPRHGRNHEFLPSEVNFRANIFALKRLGARTILSISASGSLQEEIKPGDMALASIFRPYTRQASCELLWWRRNSAYLYRYANLPCSSARCTKSSRWYRDIPTLG